MKKIAALLLTSLLFACVSADTADRPPERQRGRDVASDYERPMRGAQEATMQFLPPMNWWHNENLANAISLTADQVRALDNALSGQTEEMTRLERSAMDAMRDLRATLESDKPLEADITAAGQRLRDARNALFDRQIQMAAAERQIVTASQWKDLDALMQRSRRGRDDDRRGNRGGYPGRYPGNWPGGGPPNPWGW